MRLRAHTESICRLLGEMGLLRVARSGHMTTTMATAGAAAAADMTPGI
jgi:hypothetical protein